MKLAICSPVYGAPESASVALGYHQRMLEILRSPDVELLDTRYYTNTDLVRARSIALTAVLEGGFDRLLFWDTDVVAPADSMARAIRAMISSGHEIVGTPYARKRSDWALGEEDLERGYVLQGPEVEKVGRDGCAPCRYVPMGFTVLTRAGIDRMVSAHQHSHLRFRDRRDDPSHRSVAAFALCINEQAELLSEDYSYCQRAEWLGVQPMVYLGERLQHVGSAVYGRAT